MRRRNVTSRFGISAWVSLITVILLVVVFAGMLITIGGRLSTDIDDVQIQGFESEVKAIRHLVEFQTRLVERILKAHLLNTKYAEAFVTGNFNEAQGLLRILNSNLQILDAALMVDTNGTVLAAADDSQIGKSMRGTRIWSEIEGGAAYPVDFIPSESPFSGKPVIYYAVRVFNERDEQGTLIAVLNLATFSSIYISPMQFGETGYPFLVTTDGEMVSHPNNEIIGTDVSNEEFFLMIQEKSAANFANRRVARYTFNGEDRLLVFSPATGSIPWISAVSMSQKEMSAPAVRVIRMLMISAVVAVTIMIALLILFIRSFLIKRIHGLAGLLQIAATGNLTVQAPEKGNDEFTDISRRFNRLMMALRSLVTQVREKMDVLERGGHDLSTNVQETAAAINQINANIESTRAQIANQSVSITQTSATVEQMTKNVESLGNSIERQAESVTQSSTAVEEMVQSVRVISTTTAKASEEVKALEDVSKNGKDQLDKMVGLIREIAGMSDALGEANTVIANIASQTNLLAMNAAIEAAHAGEAGAGFSVVADEIRNLAENASAQAKIVKGRLKDVTQAVGQIVSISGDTNEAFGRITGSIDGVQRVFEEIRSAMEEQSTGGEQLLGILAGMTQITETVRSGSEEMNQGNAQILEVITSLNAISEEVKNAIDEISRGTGEINRAVSNIVELSDENTESIRLVKDETTKFFLTDDEVEAAREAEMADTEGPAEDAEETDERLTEEDSAAEDDDEGYLEEMTPEDEKEDEDEGK
ncbi:methyl-accepting chemotaxis protein [Marispirochaeta aestuarii]|uniref:methyl-accepting chemotaxis protein n=1 Tax=Marispirochaeta aestuarii TaxID=1963862 RepID=UPI0029C91B1A|nr:methyl-accepting chemotaxis protein [Marispirochaeta aestuarii]